MRVVFFFSKAIQTTRGWQRVKLYSQNIILNIIEWLVMGYSLRN